jgi:O-antigen ligase
MILIGAVVAAALGAGLNYSGWVDRAGSSVSGSASDVTSNRTQLVRQANELFADNPIVGVGPGRYVEALERRPDVVKLATQSPRPVHVVPYLVLVEGGLVALPALLLLGWYVARSSWRAGAAGFGLTAAVLPFLLLDHLNWSVPQGLLLIALWLGTLDRLAASRADAPQRVG